MAKKTKPPSPFHGRWRIMSIIWDNEREGVKLPD